MLLLVLEKLTHLFGDSALTDPPAEEAIALCGHEDEEVRRWALERLTTRARERFHAPDGVIAVEELNRGLQVAYDAVVRDLDDEFGFDTRPIGVRDLALAAK